LTFSIKEGWCEDRPTSSLVVSLGKALNGIASAQGRQQKNFQRGATERRPKSSIKRPKNSPIKPLPGKEGATKKDRKIAQLNLFLLYLYHA